MGFSIVLLSGAISISMITLKATMIWFSPMTQIPGYDLKRGFWLVGGVETVIIFLNFLHCFENDEEK
jgi:hypothetical protein